MGYGDKHSGFKLGVLLVLGAVVYFGGKLCCISEDDEIDTYTVPMARPYTSPPPAREGPTFPLAWRNLSKSFARPHKRAIRPATERVTLSSATIIPIEYPDPEITHAPHTLLGLPYELRQLILSYAIPPTDVRTRLRAAHFDSELNPGENLLLVCRQLYHELTASASMHRCVLVTPGPSTALPLGQSRLAKADSATLARVGVRELLIRDYLSGLKPGWRPDIDGKDKIRLPPELGQDTSRIVLCVCICFAKNTWDDIRRGVKVWREAFCSSIWNCVHALGWDTASEVSNRKWSARKVIIYTCGAPLNTGVFDSMLLRVRIKEMLDDRSIVEMFRDEPESALLNASDDSSFEDPNKPDEDMWLTERLPLDPTEREVYDEEKLSEPRVRGGWISEVDAASEPFARYRLRLNGQFPGNEELNDNGGVLVEIRDTITECSERCILHG